MVLGSTQAVWSKILVISDVDDTLKITNVVDKGDMLFDKYWSEKPFRHMAYLFQELQADAKSRGEEIKFYYLSAAPHFLVNNRSWVRKNNFPQGKTIQKMWIPLVSEISHLPIIRFFFEFLGLELDSVFYGSREYKMNRLREIIRKEYPRKEDRVILIGDNGEHDPVVYLDIKKEFHLDQAEIYIRDIKANSTFFPKYYNPNKEKIKAGINYFFTAMSFMKYESWGFLSDEFFDRMLDDADKKILIPEFLKERLAMNIQRQSGDEMLLDDILQDMPGIIQLYLDQF